MAANGAEMGQNWKFGLENNMERQMKHKCSHVELPSRRTFLKVCLCSL